MQVKHVVNYDVPGSASDYLHRCGRVGRVGQDLSATVTTLVSQKWEVDVVMQVEVTISSLKGCKVHNLTNLDYDEIKTLLSAREICG